MKNRPKRMLRANHFVFVAILATACGLGGCDSQDPPQEVGLPVSDPENPLSRLDDYFQAEGGASRLGAIDALPTELTLEEQTELFEFLAGPCPTDLSQDDWHHVVNNTLDRIQRLNSAPDQLGTFLVSLWKDDAGDPVLRTYALQFMGNWHTAESARSPGEQDPSVRSEMLGCLADAISRPQTPDAAVALLSLKRIDDLEEALGRNEVEMAHFQDSILTLISEDAHHATRITSLQVAADLKMDEALRVARKIAADENEKATLRVSSIAVIGKMGAGADQQILEQLANSSEPRVRYAAQQWLNKNSTERAKVS